MNIEEEWQRLTPLLELMAPEGGEALLPRLRLLLEESGGGDEFLMLQHIAAGEALFVAAADDGEALLQQLRQVAASWQANILAGSGEEDGHEWLEAYDWDTLLAAVAQELQEYGLQLWLWEQREHCCGFIARLEDEDLIQRQATQLRLPLRPVEALAAALL